MVLTDDGRLFIIDVVQSIVKDKTEFEELSMYANEFSTIEGAKLDQCFNTLVFRTRGNRFYQVGNVSSEHLKNS